MERNKVYINPNFKRIDIDSRPKDQIKTTHFNRYYLEEAPNKKANTNMNQQNSANNRKIYVNPNFIGNSVTQINQHTRPAKAEFIEENENVKSVSSRQSLHKSKYSLVCNIQQTCVKNTSNTEQISSDEYHMNNGQKVTEETYHKTKKPTYTQEIPLTRSRYCIVRKKKKLSINLEKSKNNLTMDVLNKYPVPVACVNQFTSDTFFYGINSDEKNKLRYKTPEKITKIKLTKYKTIPISYLKKSLAVETTKNKTNSSAMKPFLKSNRKINTSTINTVNKNRFKLIKSSTVNNSCNVSTVTVPSRIKEPENKNALINRSKVKISRATFNVNNIPCRLFKKYGKCLRQERGDCKYLHDKKHVSLCRKFLQGICHDEDCLLSHELTSKKMPTCYFYLRGMCTKEHCPYLHVKLSDKTKICQEFAKGYCENGDQCPFRHITIDQSKIRKLCTNTERKCPLPKIAKCKLIKVDNIKFRNVKVKNSDETKEQVDKDCRYYKELLDESCFEPLKPKRCKLGILPSFIQL